MAEVTDKTGIAENEVDRELQEIVQTHATRIKVIGCGGGGGNSVSRMKEVGIRGCEIIAINTDAQDLLYTLSDHKVLIGRELTKGLGAGSNPKIGEQAARESEPEIKEKLSNLDMVFVTCGLGGGTGTGCAPVVAELAKKAGILTIGVVTLPFSVEGQKRLENAQYGLEKLVAVTDTLIVIPNDKLLELAPELPMRTAFKIADEILTNAVKGITELITKPGLVNLDFADVKAVMTNGGLSLIGIGESESNERAKASIERAINNPLLNIDITDAKGALVNIMGGPDLSLDEYKQVMEVLGKKVAPDAKVIYGAQISEDLKKMMKVLIVVTGLKSTQIMKTFGSLNKESEEDKGKEFEQKVNLGVDRLDKDEVL